MDNGDQIQQLIEAGILTFQEARMIGGSSLGGAEKGNPWSPMAIELHKEGNLEEWNQRRRDVGYFPCIGVSILNEDAYLTLEPLNDQNVTEHDPRVILVDPETKESRLDRELTKSYYARVREKEEKFKKENPSFPEWKYSVFLRESPSRVEKEIPESPEGMRNV